METYLPKEYDNFNKFFERFKKNKAEFYINQNPEVKKWIESEINRNIDEWNKKHVDTNKLNFKR